MLRVDVFGGYRFNLVGNGFVLVGYSLCLLGMGMSLCWRMGLFWSPFFVRYIFVFVEYFGLCWVQICFLLCTYVFCLATYVLLGFGLVFVGYWFVFLGFSSVKAKTLCQLII